MTEIGLKYTEPEYLDQNTELKLESTFHLLRARLPLSNGSLPRPEVFAPSFPSASLCQATCSSTPAGKVPFGKCWFYEKTHISDIGSTHQILLDIKQNQMTWPISNPLCA